MVAGSKTMMDPDFGSLKYCVDAWDGLAPFAFEPSHTTHFAVQIKAPDSGPTDAQREVFRELKARYEQLWPSIAQALIKCCDGVSDAEELRGLLNSTVGLYMIEDFDDPSEAEFELVYDLNRPNADSQACFVRLRPWEVMEAAMAE